MVRVRLARIPRLRIRRNMEFFALMLLFRLLMDYIYKNVLATVYAYAGFHYASDIGLVTLSWLLLFLGAGMVLKAYKNTEERVSLEVVLLLFVMSFVPFTSMVGGGALETPFIVGNSAYWFILLLVTVSLQGRIRGHRFRIKSGGVRLGDFQIKALAAVFAVIVLYVSGRYAHFRFNFNLLNVYAFREEASNNRLPTLLLYAFSWTRTVNAILISYFMRRKNRLWTVGCCFIQLLSFGYDGSKSTLIMLILAVGVNLLPKFSIAAMNKWMLRGIAAIVALFALVYLLTGNFIAISIFVRRVFFLPVQIASKYFDFFTTHQPDYFRQSFMRYFGFSSPYGVSIPYLIGEVYYNSPGMSANNGLIADAITNLGYAGIVVFPILLAYIFRLLDRSSEGLDVRIFITVGIYLSLVMTNSFIFTILLTHGLIVAMIILHFMKRDNREEEDQGEPSKEAVDL